MSEYIELLGEELKIKEGSKLTTVKTEVALAGKIVGLYFSASWCVNCHAFTPKLRRAYQYAVNHGAEFSIVYCHLDQSYKDWETYYNDMPGWYAIPYERSDVVNSLKSMFNISAIPHFMMISESGIINPDARDYVEDYPEGFPWSQLSLQEEAAKLLKDHNGPADPAVLQGKNVCYFFGANSSESVQFSNKLMECYNAIKKSQGDVFEVVFFSLDENEEQYNAYYKSMAGWYTIGYDVRTVRKLLRTLGDTPIPCPIMANAEGEITSYDARDLILSTGVESFPWNTVICRDIELDNEGMLNHGLVVFMDDETQFPPEVRGNVIATLQKMANKRENAQDHTVLFNYTIEKGETTSYLRERMGEYNTAMPFIAVFEQGEDGQIYFSPAKAFQTTEDNIAKVIEDYKNNQLQKHVISG